MIGLEVSVPAVEHEPRHAGARARRPGALQADHLYRPRELEVEAGRHQKIERLIVALEPDGEVELAEVECHVGRAGRHERDQQIVDLDLGAELVSVPGFLERGGELAEDVGVFGQLAERRQRHLARGERVVAGAAGVAVAADAESGDLHRRAIHLGEVAERLAQVDRRLRGIGGLLGRGGGRAQHEAQQ